MSARWKAPRVCSPPLLDLAPFRAEWRKASKRPEWKHLPAATRFHQSYIVASGSLEDSDCWYWIGTRTNEGYGQFTVGSRSGPARRFALGEIAGVSPLPVRVHARCNDKGCVNPTHLVWDDTPTEWDDPTTAPRIKGRIIPRRAVSRFWDQVDKETGSNCWRWRGTTVPTGYGVFTVSTGVNEGAHRVSYALAHGSIPEDCNIICHGPECEGDGGAGPLCVNPEHLIAATHADNMADKNGGHHRRSLAEMPISEGTRKAAEAFMVNLGPNPEDDLDQD